jgi:hypothetical protein
MLLDDLPCEMSVAIQQRSPTLVAHICCAARGANDVREQNRGRQFLAHFRRAHFANKCLPLSDMHTMAAGNHPAPDTRTDELVRKHIDAPPLTRSQFAINIRIAIIHTPKSQYRREIRSVP